MFLQAYLCIVNTAVRKGELAGKLIQEIAKVISCVDEGKTSLQCGGGYLMSFKELSEILRKALRHQFK